MASSLLSTSGGDLASSATVILRVLGAHAGQVVLVAPERGGRLFFLPRGAPMWDLTSASTRSQNKMVEWLQMWCGGRGGCRWGTPPRSACRAGLPAARRYGTPRAWRGDSARRGSLCARGLRLNQSRRAVAAGVANGRWAAPICSPARQHRGPGASAGGRRCTAGFEGYELMNVDEPGLIIAAAASSSVHFECKRCCSNGSRVFRHEASQQSSLPHLSGGIAVSGPSCIL